MEESRGTKMLTILLILIFLIAASLADADDRTPLAPEMSKTWIEINPADVYPDFEYEGLTPSCAACPDCDAEFTFFARGGTTNNLVVYFQGGGACWDFTNCVYAKTYYSEVPPLEAFSQTSFAGIFDPVIPLNPFKDWYFVYIPYCTGDVHWGANDMRYEDQDDEIDDMQSWDIRHRGFVNFQVVLKWIQENFAGPQKIFVTGSSAGSYGAIMGFPYLKEAYPGSQVYVLGDAGNGVIGGSFETDCINNWNIQLPDWIPGFEDGYSPDMRIDSVYKNIARYYPLSKLAQFTTAWDWNQTFFYYVMLNIDDPQKWETGWPAAWCDWHDQMLAYSYSAAEAPNYRYYIAAGDYHTIMMSPTFYLERSAGVPFYRWVRAMLRNPFGMWGGPLEGSWKNWECEDCEDPPSCP